MSLQSDLEQKILNCWQITDDLDSIISCYDTRSLSEDEILNLLIGLRELYNLKFDQCFKTFDALLKERVKK